MADVSEHRSEQPQGTDRQASTTGQSPNLPRLVKLHRYSPESSVRRAIQNADVLMFRGVGILSDMIEFGTNSPYTHAGIAFRSDAVAPFRTSFGPGRILVVEAVGQGIRMGLLSETLAGYHGAVELWRLTPEHRKRFKETKAVAEARRYIGRPYAFSALLYFALDWVTGGHFNLRSRTRNRQSMFCSQLVSRAYVRGGVDLCKCREDAATSPADLQSEGRIEFVHAFTSQDPMAAASGPGGEATPAAAAPP